MTTGAETGAAQAGEIAAPTPEQLQTYFEERKALFRAPEMTDEKLAEDIDRYAR